MIATQCKCGSRVSFPDKQAGLLSSCPACKARITVPTIVNEPALETFVQPISFAEPIKQGFLFGIGLSLWFGVVAFVVLVLYVRLR